MPPIKLQAGHLATGVPLPFDTFDADGKLLLRKGLVIHTQDQLERLIERGLFSEVNPDDPKGERSAVHPGWDAASRPKSSKVPVFDLIAQVQEQLELLLVEDAPTDFSARVGHLAARLQKAFSLDGDAALAWIQMYHGGRPSTRRMIHSAILMELLLGHMDESPAQRCTVLSAALTMNLAMLDLQDELFAQSSAPSPAQRSMVHAHPMQSVALLRARGVTNETWLNVVAEHHETIDGKGYPRGLIGEQISRNAQLLSLVDRYGAMATGRGYRAAALPNVALKQIFLDKDKSVNAQLAGLLVKTVGVYPPGSVVALANGDVAVVVKRTQSASHPVVRCVKTAMNEVLAQPRKRLTSDPAYAITRLMSAKELDFALNPGVLWDEAFEFSDGGLAA